MTIYFEVLPETEAAKRLDEYEKRLKRSERKLMKLAKRLGSSNCGRHVVSTDGGRICGLAFYECPENWVPVKKMPGYFFPRRIKANRELLKEFSALEGGSTSGLAKALFLASKLHFVGLRIVLGVGLKQVAGRRFVVFRDPEHAKLYKDSMPPGLNRAAVKMVEALQKNQ